MMEDYYRMIAKYWRQHRLDPDQEKYEKFKHKLRGFLPITDMIMIETVADLTFAPESGGFVVVTLFSEKEGYSPFPLVVDDNMILLMSDWENGVWSATYAREIRDEDD